MSTGTGRRRKLVGPSSRGGRSRQPGAFPQTKLRHADIDEPNRKLRSDNDTLRSQNSDLAKELNEFKVKYQALRQEMRQLWRESTQVNRGRRLSETPVGHNAGTMASSHSPPSAPAAPSGTTTTSATSAEKPYGGEDDGRAESLRDADELHGMDEPPPVPAYNRRGRRSSILPNTNILQDDLRFSEQPHNRPPLLPPRGGSKENEHHGRQQTPSPPPTRTPPHPIPSKHAGAAAAGGSRSLERPGGASRGSGGSSSRCRLSTSPEDEERSRSNSRRASRSLERSGSAGGGDEASRTLDLSRGGGDEEDAGGDAFLRASPENRGAQPFSSPSGDASSGLPVARRRSLQTLSPPPGLTSQSRSSLECFPTAADEAGNDAARGLTQQLDPVGPAQSVGWSRRRTLSEKTPAAAEAAAAAAAAAAAGTDAGVWADTAASPAPASSRTTRREYSPPSPGATPSGLAARSRSRAATPFPSMETLPPPSNRRPRREVARPVSYQEPSLTVKMRKGHVMFPKARHPATDQLSPEIELAEETGKENPRRRRMHEEGEF